jgi:hypothetical protein
LLLGRTADAAQDVEVRGKAVADAISASTDHLRNSTQDLERVLATATGSATSALSTTASGLTGAIDQAVANASDKLGAAATHAGATLDTATASAAATLADATSDMSSKLANATSDISGKLSSATADISNVLSGASSDISNVLSGASAGISNALKQNAGDVERTLLSVAAELTRAFNLNSSPLLESLTGKAQAFSAEIDRAAGEAVRAIESKGFDFTRTMLNNSGELARLINEAGEAATGKVGGTLEKLRDTATSTIAQSQQAASAAIADMMETHNRLRLESGSVFERLREANLLLQEVMTGAHDNMNALESSLSTRLAEFSAVVNDLAARTGTASDSVHVHLDAFRSETARVLENLSELSTQFDAHGRTLVEAVELVDRSNRHAEESVGARKDSIESLVATLDMKTEDLEQRLNRFATLLDNSMEGATDRAREIGRMIAETSSQGSHTITEQFELVRQNTEQERARTIDTMREVYEQATAEVHAMLRDSSERFNELLQGMRDMAAELQRELDQTRGELRRGILDLPQETAENAAQMRRVIVDQIEALAELNRIVARHGRNIEAAPERARVAEPALAVAGGRGEAPVRPAARADHLPPPPAPAARRPEPAPQPAPGPQSAGWLSDLLHRAEDAPAAPQPRERAPAPAAPARARAPQQGRVDERMARVSIESLDALSVDIARMIDHNAATEMWERYNRGDRRAFGRQLYTPHGQRAFDDIRARYRASRDFRQTVDRYIAEFERLLDEVSRDERGGQQMVRTYLTSETGKVYTMLAHAAGRFD